MTSVCPLPLACSTAYGELTVDGWSLHGPAWCVTNLSDLRNSPSIRLENVEIEDQPGAIPKPGLDDVEDYSFPIVFSGAVDRTGTPYANPAGGLFANRDALHARLVAPIRSGTSDLPAMLELPDPDDVNGTITYLGDVQPLQLRNWQERPGGYAVATLVVRVPRPLVLDNGGE